MTRIGQARAIAEALRDTVDQSIEALATKSADGDRVSVDRMDEHQTVAYDVASVASATSAAEEMAEYAQAGDVEAEIAHAFAADVAADLTGRLLGRRTAFGLSTPVAIEAEPVLEAIADGRDPKFLAAMGQRVISSGEAGPRHLSEEREMVRETFRRFAEDQVRPVAERIHRNDEDIPDDMIAGLAELGCFAMSIPIEYGGYSEGGEEELVNMVLVTEELARGALGPAGSLITRPEIISTAILKGGTEAQKKRYLPEIAAGEKMCAVAVTEPDFGSDVAGVKVSATRDVDEYVINGVKTWCTFAGKADYLLVLARTDPDRSRGHRGLSLLIVEKPPLPGHQFEILQEAGGSMKARAISTIGYRGMHSFEVSFEDWRVPAENLIGEEGGLGQGFYLQMQGFASGRLQTAARALGVMQAALEESASYAQQRNVFGKALADYELTQTKIARMGFLIAGCRAATLRAARLLGQGAGQLEASEIKQFACRTAEWVTREAQQLHGGYGYAEEYAVSRFYVDARVLSIFEGADETLALRVIARTLLQDALNAR